MHLHMHELATTDVDPLSIRPPSGPGGECRARSRIDPCSDPSADGWVRDAIGRIVQAQVASAHPGLVNLHGPSREMPHVGQKIQSLQSQLVETKRMLRAAQRSQKRASTVSKCQWNVATILMVLRGGEPTAAMDYLRGTCLSKDRAAVVSPAVEEKLRSWWRESSRETKRLLINVDGADAKKKWALAKARRFLAECNLDIWVERQNMKKGITPMSSLVLEKGRNELRIAGIASARTRKGGLQWLRRWRRRCGVRLKKLPALDTPTEEEMAQKVRVRGQPGSRRLGGYGSINFGIGARRSPKKW